MFKENSRVCFFGASIVTNGHMMRRVWEHYRKCGINLKMYNCGIPGDTAQNGFARMHDMVFCYDPTDVVVSFGMNDIKYFLYDGRDVTDSVIMERRRAIDTNVVYMRAIAEECKKKNIRVTFYTMTPYDEFTESERPCFTGASAALRELAERVKLVAAECDADFIDSYTPFNLMVKKFFKDGKTIVGEDRIHPTKSGQELMAQIFLKGQGFDVEFTQNFDELEKAAEKPFDEWEEKRYELEKAAKCTEFAEWIVCKGIKSETIIRSIIEEKMSSEENEAIVNLSKAYLEQKDNEAEAKRILREYTEKGYE